PLACRSWAFSEVSDGKRARGDTQDAGTAPRPRRGAAGAPRSLAFRGMEAWRDRARPRPNLKEVRESLAFFEKVRRVLGRRRLVVDAAGGHGAVALAFAAAGRAERAVVADVRCPPSFERLRSACHEAVDVGHGPWLRGLLEREG
ncbi:unnamed protein product, partial [Prorocentrum cordatum]